MRHRPSGNVFVVGRGQDIIESVRNREIPRQMSLSDSNSDSGSEGPCDHGCDSRICARCQKLYCIWCNPRCDEHSFVIAHRRCDGCDIGCCELHRDRNGILPPCPHCTVAVEPFTNEHPDYASMCSECLERGIRARDIRYCTSHASMVKCESCTGGVWQHKNCVVITDIEKTLHMAELAYPELVSAGAWRKLDG